MHDAETRALRRAALILLAVSTARWGWSLAPREGAVSGADVLSELSDATRGATEEDERRRRPLVAGERIDPNRADEGDLDRLPGVGPATAASIAAARDSGIVFRRVDDLLLVQGIGPALLSRIRPSLDLTSPPRARAGRRGGNPVGPIRVDVNRADVAELQRLPGVGPAIADRIVSVRRERSFRSVDDLIRVPGIGPATLERLRALATVGRKP
jgi:competence protein ComEA